MSPGMCVSDHVISSYTPTLDVLINARREFERVSTQISLDALLIAQPIAQNFSLLPNTVNEVKNVESIVLSTTLMSDMRTGRKVATLIGQEATVETTLKALPNASIVHLACHGFQDQEDPFRRSGATCSSRLLTNPADGMHSLAALLCWTEF
jgi:CHAT domain-containing protein